MASINGVSATGYTSKGLPGLVSGMDTEKVVEGMTADIQAKIDKVRQDQQRYDWKQEAYRSVITQLTSFQDKYFSYASSTNLLSPSFFNCTSMVPGGTNAGKISVSGNSSTTKATYNITGVSQLAEKAGFTSGGVKTSGDITTGEITFGDRDVSKLAGGSIDIKYGNSKYTVNIPADAEITNAQEFADALNKAMKGTTLSIGGTLGDKLQFTAGGDGKMSLSYVNNSDSNSFSLEGGTDAVLKALHMEKGDTPRYGAINGKAEVTAGDLLKTVPFSLTGKKLSFDLNGMTKTIEFTQADSDSVTDIDSMKNLLNNKLKEKFGADKINVATDGDKLIFQTVKSDGAGGQVTDATSTLKISSSTVDTLGPGSLFNLANGEKNRLDTSKTLKDLGFKESETTADGVKLYKFKINGVDFSFKEDATVASVLSEMNNNVDAGVNVTFLATTGRFNVTADESGAQGAVKFEDVLNADGQPGLYLMDGLFGTAAERAAATTAGKDMKMTIRYEGSSTDTEITRSSNTANIDGINVTAEGTFSAYTTQADGTVVYNKNDSVSFTSKTDSDHIVSTLKSMTEDYNKMLETINKLVTTKRDKKGYEPLTDAQRKDMTEDEIKIWEDKAKEGILFGDSTLNQLASSLRFIFSTGVSNVGVMSSIGISTSSSYSDNGKLVFDEKKLKAALETDPDKVKALFTSSVTASPSLSGSANLAGGINHRMQTVMESYAKSTGSYKGKLVDLAGIANNATTNDNYIARQQKILSEKMETLKDLLKTRQDRYQRQFSKLEVYMSNMNAQSSWLNSSFQ